MLKQAGKIYCRDISKSPQKVLQYNEKLLVQDQRTIRKQTVSYQKVITLQYNKQIKQKQTQRHNQSKYKSIASEKSKFSSIRQSSVLSVDQIECLNESRASNYNNMQKNGFDVSFQNQQSKFADSLAIYENQLLKNNQIVKKLSHLNNIFKEIKNLRVQKLNRDILTQINETERDLIEVQRDILRSC